MFGTDVFVHGRESFFFMLCGITVQYSCDMMVVLIVFLVVLCVWALCSLVVAICVCGINSDDCREDAVRKQAVLNTVRQESGTTRAVVTAVT